jgi:hypothetical protein
MYMQEAKDGEKVYSIRSEYWWHPRIGIGIGIGIGTRGSVSGASRRLKPLHLRNELVELCLGGAILCLCDLDIEGIREFEFGMCGPGEGVRAEGNEGRGRERGVRERKDSRRTSYLPSH